jgi:hypothetical protein
MTKKTLEQALEINEQMDNLKIEINSINDFIATDKELAITDFSHSLFLKKEETFNLLRALLRRKTEELKLLKEEFERL